MPLDLKGKETEAKGKTKGIEMKMKDTPGKSGFQTFKHCYDAGVNFKNTGDTLINCTTVYL